MKVIKYGLAVFLGIAIALTVVAIYGGCLDRGTEIGTGTEGISFSAYKRCCQFCRPGGIAVLYPEMLVQVTFAVEYHKTDVCDQFFVGIDGLCLETFRA